MKWLRRSLLLVVAVVVVLAGYAYLAGHGYWGNRQHPGHVSETPRAAAFIADKEKRQGQGAAADKQILFGDLHVHTTYSFDAYNISLPMYDGEGSHPPADACDFARYCSALDFWSINDHALAHTPASWQDTKEAIRQCNAVSGDEENPDVVAYLGWEWTQIGKTREVHYGHKNVILRDLGEDEIPARPISAGFPPDANPDEIPTLGLGMLPFLMGFNSDTFDYIDYMQHLAATPNCPDGVDTRKLPNNCREISRTPEGLFAKLASWDVNSMVIPHGTTWGFYTPAGSSWDKQLTLKQHDPAQQGLVEVYSGHGNSEEYRDWREVIIGSDGEQICPEPSDNFLPSCWRAGQIIYQRCLEDSGTEEACDSRAAEARQHYLDAGLMGFLTVTGISGKDWLDSGQCTDCFLPAFNYRPLSSVQYMMALSNFDEMQGDKPLRFRFGFMASSDNHSGRPGTGYKEFARTAFTEARFGEFDRNPIDKRIERPVTSHSEPFAEEDYPNRFASIKETERQGSFFLNGGLVAVHSPSRNREAIWEALQKRQVYGTSGPRILLWFDMIGDDGEKLPMGGETTRGDAPRFKVRAVGSLEQNPGCPDYANQALGEERKQYLCRGECYNPSDIRRRITRIEVIRIRPQASPDEPVAQLINDPWKILLCDKNSDNCEVEFSDGDFTESARDTLYYVRAIEAPSEKVNGDPLRCSRDEFGKCIEVDLCTTLDPEDNCLSKVEERAWSSPIFVDFDSSMISPAEPELSEEVASAEAVWNKPTAPHQNPLP